jgi:hypothetical protein
LGHYLPQLLGVAIVEMRYTLMTPEERCSSYAPNCRSRRQIFQAGSVGQGASCESPAA